MIRIVIALLVSWCAVAVAQPEMVSYDAGTFSILVPKGWTTSGDAATQVVSLQTPTRKYTGQLVVVSTTDPKVTRDQMLEAMIERYVPNANVTKREQLPRRKGRLVVADGVVETVHLRVAAVAIDGGRVGLVVWLFVANATLFDWLGGVELAKTSAAGMKS